MLGLEILDMQFSGNTLQSYLEAFTVFVVSIFILQIIKAVLLVKLQDFADKTANEWDNILCKALESLGWLFYFIVSLYASTRFISLADFINTIIYSATLIIVTYYAIGALQIILEFGLDQILKKSQGDKLDNTILRFFHNALKIGLWVSAVILILQNLGYEVGALLGGLGIAGIAIAFALQNILTDIFSFFSIYFDKPFRKGDFIIVDNDMGTVEHIGIKSTRIRTLQGQQLIISNQELTSVRVNNYKRMEERRAVFHFRIRYETPPTLVKKIPELIKKIIENNERTRFDRAHFTEFGDSSLNFEVVYYVDTQDYNVYRDVQQDINIAVMETFTKNRIEFAYPTQLVYLRKSSESK